MRYEPLRVQQANQKQLLKSTIKMYHRPEVNELKPKSNPCIAFNNTHNFNGKSPNYHNSHNQNNANCQSGYQQLLTIYKKLSTTLQKQTGFFKDGCTRLKQMTLLYYEELIKIIKNSQKNAMRQIQFILHEAQQKFASHLEIISKSLWEVKNGNSKKSLQQIKSEFLQLSIIEVPVYKIEGNPFKQFQKLIYEFKPSFVHPTNLSRAHKKYPGDQKLSTFNQASNCMKKQNKENYKELSPEHQIEQAKSDTVKKPSHTPNTNQAIPSQDICQFACDQQFEWNPDEMMSRKMQKKQMASEIILEEPSSCEDSLMLSQVP